MAEEITQDAGASSGETATETGQTDANAEGAGTATSTPGATEQTGTGGNEAEKPSTSAKPEYPDLREALRATTRERGELKGKATDLEAKVAELEAELQAARTGAGPQAAASTTIGEGYLDGRVINAELAGLPYDPKDKTFEIEPGQWRTQREALAIVRAEKAHESAQQSEQQAAEARRQEQSQAVTGAMLKEIERAAGMIAVPAEAAQVPQWIIADVVAEGLMAKGIDLSDPSSLNDDVIGVFGALMVEAETKAKAMIAAIQGMQATANAQASASAPLKPSGPAAQTVPAGLRDAKPQDKASYLKGLADRIFAKHGLATED